MKRFLGILLMTFANIILLAHSIIPHSNCKEDHNHSEETCHHDHDHSHSHVVSTTESDFDLSHLFCHVAHGESDFIYQNEINNEINVNPIILFSICYCLLNDSSIEEVLNDKLIVAEKIPIYNSPHLIRSGQKAPPIA